MISSWYPSFLLILAQHWLLLSIGLCNKLTLLVTSIFVFGKILSECKQKQRSYWSNKRFFCRKYGPKFPYFEEKQLKSPYLDHKFQHVTIYNITRILIVLFNLSLSYSQIWLGPFVDDYQPNYLKKLETKPSCKHFIFILPPLYNPFQK
jgi:hypothetical protein